MIRVLPFPQSAAPSPIRSSPAVGALTQQMPSFVGTAAKASEEKGTETTDEALELALQSLIDDEDKHHPLSDQTLCDKLNAMGIP